MEFRTIIDTPKSSLQINHQSDMMLLGSCFAQNIGSCLEDNKFRVNVNPFGILYNPASIAKVLSRLLYKIPFDETDLFYHDELYHSFLHHGSFSKPDQVECLHCINEAYDKALEDLSKTNVLIITFGTAYAFISRETGDVVANCHKLPASDFERIRLSIDRILDEWDPLILKLRNNNPDLNILFTVSPIRHWKDGAHENQLSKASLLLAIDELQKNYSSVHYYPAYELLLDELRDYRFYAEDMLHPNQTAIKYIWDTFRKTYFDEETESIIAEWQNIKQALNHKPFNPNTDAHKQFLKQTLLKLEAFQQKYPFFEYEKEQSVLEDQQPLLTNSEQAKWNIR